MDKVQYIGLSDLDKVDQSVIQKIVSEYYPKVQQKLHNDTSLVVHIKQYSKGGHRPKHSIHLRALAPTRMFETNKTHEWDISKSMHHAFDDLLREIEHSFKEKKGWRSSVREWLIGRKQ